MVKIRADELLRKDIPKIEYLVEGIIPKNGLVYCFGSAGSFKTNFLLYSAICSTMEKNVFEFKTEKFRTLWIDEENRESGMKDKLGKIARGLEAEDKHIQNIEILISEGFNILGKESIEKLKKDIEEFNPQMIVIDSIAKVFPLNERDEKDVRKIYTILRPIIEKYNVSIILIHHARKKNFMQFSQEMEDISGSREFTAMADSIILLDEIKEGTFLLKQVKNRYSSKTHALNFDVIGDEEEINVLYTGRVIDKYTDKTNQCKTDILKWIEDKNISEFKRKEALEIMKEKGHKASAIDSALKSLKGNELDWIYGIYSLKQKE